MDTFAIRRHGESSWTYPAQSGLFIASAVIPEPEPKTSLEDIPGLNGLLDFSEANGLCFQNRTITLDCKLREPHSFNERSFRQAFLGRVIDLVILSGSAVTSADLYYTGRLSITETTLSRRDPQLKLSINAAPFRHYAGSAGRTADIPANSLWSTEQILGTELTEAQMNAEDYPGWSHSLGVGTDGIFRVGIDQDEGEAGGGCILRLPMSEGRYVLWRDADNGKATLGGMGDTLYANTYKRTGTSRVRTRSFTAFVCPGTDHPLEHRSLRLRLAPGAQDTDALFRLALWRLTPTTVMNNGDFTIFPDFAVDQSVLVYLNGEFFYMVAYDNWSPYLTLRPGSNELAAFGLDRQRGTLSLSFEEAVF